MDAKPPRFFPTPAAFRTWLRRHHRTERELWVGFHKKGSGRASITWPESVDEALSVGWIDGIRKSIDAESYMIRFTPRKPGSTWSAVNIRRVAVLTEEGRMRPAGVTAFVARTAERSGVYSFEQQDAPELSAAERKRFKSNAKAWRFFDAQPAGYRRTATWWVVSAKRAETRERRLETLVADSAAGLRLAQLRRSPK